MLGSGIVLRNVKMEPELPLDNKIEVKPLKRCTSEKNRIMESIRTAGKRKSIIYRTGVPIFDRHSGAEV